MFEEYNFLDVFDDRIVGVVTIVALVGGVIGPLLGVASIVEAIAYMEALVITGLVYTIIGLWKEAEGQATLDEFLEPKRRSHAVLEEKINTVEIREDGPDKLTYDNVISAAFEDEPITQFYALIGTDRDMELNQEDMREMLEVEGGVYERHERRDWFKYARYLVTFRLTGSVGQNDQHSLRYTYEHDVVSPEADAGNLVVREETKIAELNIGFPDGWTPTTCHCYNDMDENEPCEIAPDIVEEDDEWRIKWRNTDVALNDMYRLTWTAEKTE